MNMVSSYLLESLFHDKIMYLSVLQASVVEPEHQSFMGRWKYSGLRNIEYT